MKLDFSKLMSAHRSKIKDFNERNVLSRKEYAVQQELYAFYEVLVEAINEAGMAEKDSPTRCQSCGREATISLLLSGVLNYPACKDCEKEIRKIIETNSYVYSPEPQCKHHYVRHHSFKDYFSSTIKDAMCCDMCGDWIAVEQVVKPETFPMLSNEAILDITDSWFLNAVYVGEGKRAKMQIFETPIKGTFENSLKEHRLDIARALIYSRRKKGNGLQVAWGDSNQITGFVVKEKRLPTKIDLCRVKYTELFVIHPKGNEFRKFNSLFSRVVLFDSDLE